LLTYEFAGRVDKSHDFYPKWTTGGMNDHFLLYD
jgi:hypothetical protein